MNKYIEQVDRETGEVMQRMYGLHPLPTKAYRKVVYGLQDTFIEIAKDPDMTGETMKVLMYLFGKLDFENFIQQTQIDVAEGLGMRKQNVNRAMQILTAKQIVLEGPKVGRSKCYRLNPNYGWKGKVKTLQELRKEQFKVIEGGKE